MLEPLIPENEVQRLQALRSLALLDTEAEDEYDRITNIAKYAFKVPICLVSLIDDSRQWFKSCQGISVLQTPRSISFCGHAIQHKKVFIIPNAPMDSRFADNPLVTGDPHIRFYAGYPLSAPSGELMGTLCIISDEARTLEKHEIKVLEDLGTLVEEQFMIRSKKLGVPDKA